MVYTGHCLCVRLWKRPADRPARQYQSGLQGNAPWGSLSPTRCRMPDSVGPKSDPKPACEFTSSAWTTGAFAIRWQSILALGARVRGVVALGQVLEIEMVQICVVVMLAWPSISCTARRSPDDCSRWLANEWRSACGWCAG